MLCIQHNSVSTWLALRFVNHAGEIDRSVVSYIPGVAIFEERDHVNLLLVGEDAVDQFAVKTRCHGLN